MDEKNMSKKKRLGLTLAILAGLALVCIIIWRQRVAQVELYSQPDFFQEIHEQEPLALVGKAESASDQLYYCRSDLGEEAELLVKEGDHVKRGAPLYRAHNAKLAQEVADGEKELAQLKATGKQGPQGEKQAQALASAQMEKQTKLLAALQAEKKATQERQMNQAKAQMATTLARTRAQLQGQLGDLMKKMGQAGSQDLKGLDLAKLSAEDLETLKQMLDKYKEDNGKSISSEDLAKLEDLLKAQAQQQAKDPNKAHSQTPSQTPGQNSTGGQDPTGGQTFGNLGTSSDFAEFLTPGDPDEELESLGLSGASSSLSGSSLSGFGSGLSGSGAGLTGAAADLPDAASALGQAGSGLSNSDLAASAADLMGGQGQALANGSLSGAKGGSKGGSKGLNLGDAQASSLDAQVRKLEAQLDELRDQVDQEVTAIAGGTVHIDEAGLTDPHTPLIAIHGVGTRVYLEAETAEEAMTLQEGDPVQLLVSADQRQQTGRVSYIQTDPFYLEVETAEYIQPGYAVTIQLPREGYEIQPSALIQEGNATYVFRLVDGRVTKQAVQVKTEGSRQIVVQGLSEGDFVLLKPDQVKEGQAIHEPVSDSSQA